MDFASISIPVCNTATPIDRVFAYLWCCNKLYGNNFDLKQTSSDVKIGPVCTRGNKAITVLLLSGSGKFVTYYITYKEPLKLTMPVVENQ